MFVVYMCVCGVGNFMLWSCVFQRDYEEFKVRINGLVVKVQKILEEGWIMVDGIFWLGNNICDYFGMIQVFIL